jgi:hypothetical protein
MLCVWPEEWGHCEHQAISPKLQSPEEAASPGKQQGRDPLTSLCYSGFFI